MRSFTPPEICPVCGEEVPRKAKACPECGADERSGWREDAAIHDGLDLPDPDDDDAHSASSKTAPSLAQIVIWVVSAIVLIAFLLACF